MFKGNQLTAHAMNASSTTNSFRTTLVHRYDGGNKRLKRSRVFIVNDYTFCVKVLQMFQQKSAYLQVYSIILMLRLELYYKPLNMPILRVFCWALLFLFRLRFPPGTSAARILKKCFYQSKNVDVSEKI